MEERVYRFSGNYARMPFHMQAPRAALGLLLALVVGWGLGTHYERERLSPYTDIGDSTGFETGSGDVLADPEHDADLSLLWEVWNVLNEMYVSPEKLTDRSLMTGMVRGLVEGVGDPYTAYMTTDENAAFFSTLQGELEGIGAELSIKDDVVTVVQPIKGSPAERAGILPDDLIYKVDGEEMVGKSLDDVVSRIRGKPDTQVKLDIIREGEDDVIALTITRAKIHVPSTNLTIISSGATVMGYLELNRFDSSVVRETQQALEELKNTPDLSGIILDLRGNGGGLLDAAVDIASFFLPQGDVVKVERRGGESETLYASGSPLLPDTPLIILVNEGTASASEILAGALHDHGRATLIGQKTFGKGTVQEIVPLSDGSSLRVTVAHWLTPGGINLAKEGIVPDIEVERTIEQFRDGIDPQLERAKEELMK